MPSIDCVERASQSESGPQSPLSPSSSKKNKSSTSTEKKIKKAKVKMLVKPVMQSCVFTKMQDWNKEVLRDENVNYWPDDLIESIKVISEKPCDQPAGTEFKFTFDQEPAARNFV